MKPGKVMIVPEAANWTAAAPAAPPTGTSTRTEAVRPRASAICEATVRFQMSSYRANWRSLSKDLTVAGVRK